MNYAHILKLSNITTNVDFLKGKHLATRPHEAHDLGEVLKHRLEKFNRDNPDARGVGLAAPQIGIPRRACYMRNESFELYLCNPVVVDSYGHFGIVEGCLSIPNKRVFVQRAEVVHVVDDMHPNGIILSGMEAIIAQHEIDHLDGRIITDYLQEQSVSDKIPRNSPCPCGNEKKYKKCCGK